MTTADVDTFGIALPPEWLRIPLEDGAFEPFVRTQRRRLAEAGDLSMTAQRQFELLMRQLRTDCRRADITLAAVLLATIDEPVTLTDDTDQRDHDDRAGRAGHDDRADHDRHRGHGDHDEVGGRRNHAGHDGHDERGDHGGQAGHDGHDERVDHDDQAGHDGHDDRAGRDGHRGHDEREGHDDHDDQTDHDRHNRHDDRAGHDGHRGYDERGGPDDQAVHDARHDQAGHEGHRGRQERDGHDGYHDQVGHDGLRGHDERDDASGHDGNVRSGERGGGLRVEAGLLSASCTIGALTRSRLGSDLPLTVNTIAAAMGRIAPSQDPGTDGAAEVVDLDPPTIVDLPAGRAVRLVRLHTWAPDPVTRQRPALFAQHLVIPYDDGERAAVVTFASPTQTYARPLAALFDAMAQTFRMFAGDDPTDPTAQPARRDTSNR